MGYGYIKTNINVMKFDYIKDRDQVIFNHYIMRRENLNRIQKDLPIGQFTLTVTGVSKDLNISRVRAQRLIKEFQHKNIIKIITKGNYKNQNFSVYEYVTSDIGCDTGSDTDECRNTNRLRDTLDIGDDTDCDTFKKENLNIKLNNKDIYIRIVDYLNKTTGKCFKSTTKKTVTCMKARINEGFVEEDFYKVIDTKSRQWLHNDMNKFLRPETLFSNKFEGYLNEDIASTEEVQDELDAWDIEFEY